MKLTNTIKNILNEIEIKYINPWEDNFNPEPKSIIKDSSENKPKECIFCGDIVPLLWEIDNNGGKLRNTTPCKDDWLLNKEHYYYRQVANNIHPKCNKLKNMFSDWGISEKRALEANSFNVCEENQKAYTIIIDWIKEPKTTGLYLFGPCGVGKTLLATKIILETDGLYKLIISESDLYKRLTPRINDISRQEEIDDNFEMFKYIPLLIIDDLGIGRNSPWKTEILFEILSTRIDKSLPTFFTSNETTKTLSEHIDERNVSRISELSIPCYVGGNDHRKTRISN